MATHSQSFHLGTQRPSSLFDGAAYLDPFIAWLGRKPKEKVIADRKKFMAGDAERRLEVIVGYCREWMSEIATDVSFQPVFDNREVRRKDSSEIIQIVGGNKRSMMDLSDNKWRITPILECAETGSRPEEQGLACIESFSTIIEEVPRVLHDLAFVVREPLLTQNITPFVPSGIPSGDIFFNAIVAAGHEMTHVLQEIAREENFFTSKCLRQWLPVIARYQHETHAIRIHRQFSDAITAKFLSMTLAEGHDFQI